MKIRIELEEDVAEEEVIIRCSQLSADIVKLQKIIEETSKTSNQFVFYKGETQYYLALDEILFFETNGPEIDVHTVDNVYHTKYKLYELEDMLPGIFLRISKSAIVNITKIYSVSRNLTASSLIEFQNTHKQIYVSRSYYKSLKSKLEEKRLLS